MMRSTLQILLFTTQDDPAPISASRWEPNLIGLYQPRGRQGMRRTGDMNMSAAGATVLEETEVVIERGAGPKCLWAIKDPHRAADDARSACHCGSQAGTVAEIGYPSEVFLSILAKPLNRGADGC